MSFAMSEHQTEQLRRLCVAHGVVRLKLFGSATGPDFDTERSDLDFLVEFGDPPSNMRLSTQYFAFLDSLEQLFGKHVDLLEEPAIENTRLKASARASAITLYAA